MFCGRGLRYSCRQRCSLRCLHLSQTSTISDKEQELQAFWFRLMRPGTPSIGMTYDYSTVKVTSHRSTACWMNRRQRTWLHMSFSDLSMAQLSLYCKWMKASSMATQVDQTDFMERNETAFQTFLWKRGAPSGLPCPRASEGLVQLVNLHRADLPAPGARMKSILRAHRESMPREHIGHSTFDLYMYISRL